MTGPIRTILAAVDFSASSERAFDYALAVAKARRRHPARPPRLAGSALVPSHRFAACRTDHADRERARFVASVGGARARRAARTGRAGWGGLPHPSGDRGRIGDDRPGGAGAGSRSRSGRRARSFRTCARASRQRGGAGDAHLDLPGGRGSRARPGAPAPAAPQGRGRGGLLAPGASCPRARAPPRRGPGAAGDRAALCALRPQGDRDDRGCGGRPGARRGGEPSAPASSRSGATRSATRVGGCGVAWYTSVPRTRS